MTDYYVMCVQSGTIIREHGFEKNPNNGGYLFTQDEALEYLNKTADAFMPIAIRKHTLERMFLQDKE